MGGRRGEQELADCVPLLPPRIQGPQQKKRERDDSNNHSAQSDGQTGLNVGNTAANGGCRVAVDDFNFHGGFRFGVTYGSILCRFLTVPLIAVAVYLIRIALRGHAPLQSALLLITGP